MDHSLFLANEDVTTENLLRRPRKEVGYRVVAKHEQHLIATADQFADDVDVAKTHESSIPPALDALGGNKRISVFGRAVQKNNIPPSGHVHIPHDRMSVTPIGRPHASAGSVNRSKVDAPISRQGT